MTPKVYLDITPWERGPTTGVGTAIHETFQAFRLLKNHEKLFEIKLICRESPSNEALSFGVVKQSKMKRVFGERNSLFHSFELKLSPAILSKKVITIFDIWSLEPNPYQDSQFQGIKGKALAQAVSHADAIIVTCETVRDRLMKAQLDISCPVYNIPLGPSLNPQNSEPDSPRLKRYLTKQRPFLLSVATFEKRKNQSLWLKALLNWRSCPFDLVTLGKPGFNGKEALQLLRAVRESGLQGLDLETASIRDLQALYSQCSCVLLTSFDEGFGFPALDALNFKKPVFLSDIAPLREIAGKAGTYVSLQETDSKVVRGLLMDCVSKQDSQAWKDLAEQRTRLFSWGKQTTSILEVYQKLLDFHL